MRGKERFPEYRFPYMRITPAYAGKRYIFPFPPFVFGDHPRLCGEKSYSHVIFRHCSGSPPPMRGKGDKFLTIFTTVRITPAYAGKSSFFVRLLDFR